MFLRVKDVLNLYLCHRFYFPGILVGPYLDLSEYRSLIHETMFDDDKVKERNKHGRKLPSGRKRNAYGKMVMGLIYLGIFVVFGGSNNYSTALTPWFTEHNLFVRCVVSCLQTRLPHIFQYLLVPDLWLP